MLQKLSLAVFADNSPAIGLYRSLGFIEEGRRIGEYREEDGRLRDDLIMARSVRRA
jgi:ribosomal protein S18 acetylase RimI-like enzyme